MSQLLIHYREAFYEESRQVVDSASAVAGMPRGLVGRQVANAEMLHALIRHGSDETMSFLVQGDGDAAALKALLRKHLPSNKKAVIKRFESLSSWIPQLSETVIWQPQPPSSMFAWLRQRHDSHKVAISGVTHALCSAVTMQAIRDLVAAPVTAPDRLVCTSDAVAHTARVLVEHASRLCGRPFNQDTIQLETIPLGVDCDRHQPATPEQRREVRRQLGIDDQTDVLLFVGRLSHHAKSNPMPLFRGCQGASQQSGRKLALILAGWYANDAIRKAHESEARRLAPNIQLVQVNAMDPQWRESVWAAADVFVSLADSVQETFGLTIVEAMSRCLPVIATDWNGYRESIQHGKTGLLIPTSMIEGAAERSLQAHHEGHLSYDQFLASASQAVRVDETAVAAAINELVTSPKRRQELGEAGQRLARERFDWSNVIKQYEELWERQRALLRRRASRETPRSSAQSSPTNTESSGRPRTVIPSFRQMFSKYPSTWVSSDERFVAGAAALGDRQALSQSPLASHARNWRASDSETDTLIQQILQTTVSSVGDVDTRAESNSTSTDNATSTDKATAIDTVAWAHKYDLIRAPHPIEIKDQSRSRVSSSSTAKLTLVTTCMGRLEHLKQSLPRMVRQPNCDVVVVDYSCPEGTSNWVRSEFDSESVHVVSVAGCTQYDRSDARNLGWQVAETPLVAFVDADMLLSDNFAEQVDRRMRSGSFLRCVMANGATGRGGLIVVARDVIEEVGGYEPNFRGWGEEDEDLVDALIFHGQHLADLPDEVATHIEHDDADRTQHHATSSMRERWLINRTFRLAKWDLARQLGRVPSRDDRAQLYEMIEQKIGSAYPHQDVIEVRVPCRVGISRQFQVNVTQDFVYRIEKSDAG